MEKQKTAVEWYAEQEIKLTLDFLANKINQLEYGIKRVKLIEQAKEMKKEQIINARATAPILPSIDKADYFIEALKYYNETFKSE